MNYTVIMSIYKKVPVQFLKVSIDSVLNQTITPDEFIIVKDGPLTSEQNELINKINFENNKIIKIINFEQNVGCGIAYNEAIKQCKTKYATIMDSDDYIIPTKNEQQLLFLEKHNEYDIIGSNVYEFMGNIKNITSLRLLPEKHEDIVKFAHKRCPIAQPTAMFKVESVIKSGNYQNSKLTEDYDLYIRMMMKECKFYNMQNVLTYMRVNDDFYSRRGGIKYVKPILSFKYKWYKNGFYSLPQFLITFFASLFVSLIPNKLRKNIYNKLLRSEVIINEK